MNKHDQANSFYNKRSCWVFFGHWETDSELVSGTKGFTWQTVWLQAFLDLSKTKYGDWSEKKEIQLNDSSRRYQRLGLQISMTLPFAYRCGQSHSQPRIHASVFVRSNFVIKSLNKTSLWYGEVQIGFQIVISNFDDIYIYININMN